MNMMQMKGEKDFFLTFAVNPEPAFQKTLKT
jgi:hypothetical protein